MISLRDVIVCGNERNLLTIERLDLEPGERLLVRGPNGSGKTTLLRVLAGLEPRAVGKVTGLHPAGRTVLVHQDPFVFNGSVRSNVALGLSGRRSRRDRGREKIEDAMTAFGLKDIETQDAKTLSGGERRRVALARAVILEPELLLLDEPVADLDEQGVRSLATAIDSLETTTVVITSPKDEIGIMVDRIHDL